MSFNLATEKNTFIKRTAMKQEIRSSKINSFESLIEIVSSLDFEEKRQLWQILDQEMRTVKIEDDDEVIAPEEIAISENAWDDYISGRDSGISSQDLKRKLFGKNCN
jgi:hypothetical protein